MEDLERYIAEVVEPTVAEFEQDPSSRRRAFLACVALYHSIDYLAYPAKGKSLLQTLRANSSAFAKIGIFAHAFKHVKSDGMNQILASDIIERPGARGGVAVSGLSRCGDGDGGVVLRGAHDQDLLEVVKAALAYLKSIDRSIFDSKAKVGRRSRRSAA